MGKHAQDAFDLGMIGGTECHSQQTAIPHGVSPPVRWGWQKRASQRAAVAVHDLVVNMVGQLISGPLHLRF